MTIEQQDAFGVYGDFLRLSVLFTLVIGSFLIFIYLWKKGRLDWDEEPKQIMMENDDHG